MEERLFPLPIVSPSLRKHPFLLEERGETDVFAGYVCAFDFLITAIFIGIPSGSLCRGESSCLMTPVMSASQEALHSE